MSDCLQNEDSIVSDLSSSNADSLTGTLDSGDNVNSDISIGDAVVSSISDGDSTDSNLGDDGSLYSELSLGGGGGAKYTGQETDSIVVTVDNNVYTISASLKPIKFDSVADFPETGSEKLIYVDFSNKALYGWDSTKGVYYKLVADVKVPTKLSEFTNDAGFITNTVNNLVEYYKKTETYTQSEIDSKISAIPKFAIKVVTELPTTDISETTVYLVASGSDNQNLYIEYIYVDGVWEKLGEQTLDLSNYPNIEQMNTAISNALANYVPNTRKINGKVLSSDIDLTAEDVGALPSDTPLFSGNYNDLSNKPTLFSGDYNDLTNKPTIPTNNNQLTNGAGYITQTRPAGSGVAFQAKDGTHFMLYGNSQNAELYTQIKQTDGTNHYTKLMDLSGKLYSNSKEVAIKDDIPTTVAELTDSAEYAKNPSHYYGAEYFYLVGRIGDALYDYPYIRISNGNLEVNSYLANSGNLYVASKIYQGNKEVALKEETLPSSIKYGASIDLTMDSSTFVVTAQLKDQDGNNLGSAKTIDLPLESVVVSGAYDNTTKKVVLTLKDGSKVDFSVADLVSGLQSEITSTNKLSVNLIDGIDNYALKSVVDGVKTQASNAEAMARSNRSDISVLQSNQYTGSTYYYGTSSTDATTAVKIVESSNFKLVTGARISVYFANANDTTTTQINVNSTGAIYVGYVIEGSGMAGLPRNWWRAGQVVDFVYNGTYFLVTTGKADTTYYGAVKLTDDVSTYNAGWALSQRAGYDLSNRVKTLENTGGGGTKIIWREWT